MLPWWVSGKESASKAGDIELVTEWKGFPGGLDGKESACSAGDWDSISGSGRSLEKEMATHSSILP